MTPAPSEPQKTTNSQHTSIPKSHFGHDHERAQIQPQRGERAQIKRNKTVQHAKGQTRQHFGPAERAQIQPQRGER
jgi:hypothetical protein